MRKHIPCADLLPGERAVHLLPCVIKLVTLRCKLKRGSGLALGPLGAYNLKANASTSSLEAESACYPSSSSTSCGLHAGPAHGAYRALSHRASFCNARRFGGNATAELVEVAEALTTVVTELQDINTIQSHNLQKLVSYPDPAPRLSRWKGRQPAVRGQPAVRARGRSLPPTASGAYESVAVTVLYKSRGDRKHALAYHLGRLSVQVRHTPARQTAHYACTCTHARVQMHLGLSHVYKPP